MLAGCWSIYKRELKGFLQTGSTWIAFALLFFLIGAVYHQIIVEFVHRSAMAEAGGPFMSSDKAPNITVGVIEQVFRLLSVFILFAVPILSMRLVAAERSGGTFELLATCPVSDWGILLGKYFALLTVGLAMAALSSVYPLTTYYLGKAQGAIPEWPVVAACCVGLFFIFSTYAAFGLMASALTDSQVTAAILTLVGLLFWNTLGEFQIPGSALQAVAQELSAARHTENFTAGLITLRDTAFYFLASFVCLFAAARALEARRWKI